MFSSVLNGVLDLIFIGGLGFGIVCSAVTTVAAEAVSAGLSVWYVYQKIPLLRLERGEFVMDRGLLKTTLQYGSVTALQQSCQPVGKVLIQGAVNTLGVDVIAAYNAVTRIDDFACLPEQSISHGITTFVAQNRGAQKPERMKKALAAGFCWSLDTGLEFVRGAFDSKYGIKAVCHRRKRRGHCSHWRSVSCNYGIFLYFSRLYQWISGLLPGHGHDENDPSGNLYSDQSAGHFHMAPHAFYGNQRSSLCPRRWVERYASC